MTLMVEHSLFVSALNENRCPQVSLSISVAFVPLTSNNKNYFVYTEMTIYLLTLKQGSWIYKYSLIFSHVRSPISVAMPMHWVLSPQDQRLRQSQAVWLMTQSVKTVYTTSGWTFKLFRYVNMQGKTKNNFCKAFSCSGTKPQDFKGSRPTRGHRCVKWNLGEYQSYSLIICCWSEELQQSFPTQSG